MKILVLGAGDPIPTFILRRLEYFDRLDIQQVVFGTGAQQLSGCRHHVFVRKMVRRNTTLAEAVARAVFVLFHLRSFNSILPDIQGQGLLDKWKKAAQVLPLCFIKDLDIIHIQWITSVSDWIWLKKFYPGVPIIGSARGSDLTVFPATDPEYARKLHHSIASADFIHCVSRDMAQKCLQHGAAAARLFVNYNGIDLRKFAPPPAGRTVNRKTPVNLMTVGTLIPRKGHIFQLLITKKLLDSGIDVALWIIGAGDLKTSLVYQADRLNIGAQVHFTGALPEPSIREHLANAHLFLSTSYAEGLSNSVVEAAATGLPVIAFNCEGMQEIITHNISGMLVAYGDVDGAATAIESLVNQPDRYHALSVAARKKAEEAFDAGVHLAAMAAFYRKIARG